MRVHSHAPHSSTFQDCSVRLPFSKREPFGGMALYVFVFALAYQVVTLELDSLAQLKALVCK